MSVQGLACNYDKSITTSTIQMYTPYIELSATFFLDSNFFKELFIILNVEF